MSSDLATVEQALRGSGFMPRGAFRPEPEDGVPEIVPGITARTLVLAGNAGRSIWLAFSAEREPGRDSLDEWSKEKLTAMATELGAVALFPFTRPYLPFQRWAQRAEACHPSPLGMFIHPDYGLWHGYRGALAFAEPLSVLPTPDRRESPCTTCAGRPCLGACPVNAFSDEGYDVAACVRHITTEAGLTDWRKLGQGLHARYAVPDFSAGVRFLAAVDEAEGFGKEGADMKLLAQLPSEGRLDRVAGVIQVFRVDVPSADYRVTYSHIGLDDHTKSSRLLHTNRPTTDAQILRRKHGEDAVWTSWRESSST
jgi:ferredoxin